MRSTMKRVLSLMLAVCLLLPCLPTGVVAVEGSEQTQPTQVIYDFQLELTDKVNSSGSSFGGAALTGTANQGAIAGYYAAGEMNWKYAADNNLSFKTETNQSFAMLYFGGGPNNNVWTGLRLGIKTEENGAATYPVGAWSALTIKVPTAGKYALSLDHQIRADGTTAGEIYFLEGTYADNAAIEAAIANASAQKTVDFSKSDFDIEDAQTSLGKKQLNAGEYTLIFKATAKRTAASACFFYLKKLTMTLEEEINTDELRNVSYNFLQSYVNETTGKSFTGKYFTTIPNSDVDGYYADETLNWKIAASNAAAKLAASDYAKMDTYLAYGNGSNWAGLRLAIRAEDSAGTGVYQTGHWYAFTLASPGEGTFDVTLKYQTRNDANRDTKVYLLPGALTDPAEIQAAIDAATSLTSNFDARVDNAGNTSNTSTTYVDSTRSLGVQTLEDSEYTLVIHAADTNGVGFYLTGLELAERLVIEDTTGETTGETTTAPEDTTAPEETTTAPEEDIPETVDPYRFAIGGTALTVGGADFAGKTLDNAAVMEALQSYYTDGTLSWKFENLNNFASFAAEGSTLMPMYYIGGSDVYKWSGIRLGLKVETAEGNTFPGGIWTAMTLRSPGKGLYQLYLDYQTRSDASPEGEVYLIKGTCADTAAVEAAMTTDNLLKTLDMSSRTVEMADTSKLLGTLELEAGEYTIVFKAAKGTAGGNYFYVDQLRFVETEPEKELPPVQKDKVVYDFTLGTNGLTTEDGAEMGGLLLSNLNVKEALAQYYKSQTLYWKYTGLNNLDSFKTADNEVYDMDYIGGTASYKWSGTRIGLKVSGPEKDEKGELVNTFPGGLWTAVTIHSPGTGYYAWTLNYQTRADGTPAGEIYLIKGTFTEVKAVEAAMTPENLLKTIDFSSRTYDMANASRELGALQMEKGEYTLVFKATEGTKGGAYFYLNSLVAEKTQPEPPKQPLQTNKLVYDFTAFGKDGLKTLNGEVMAGKLITDKAVKEAAAEYYDDRTVSWKYTLDNLSSFQKANNQVYCMDFIGGTDSYKWTGLRLGIKVSGPEKNEKGEPVNTFPAGWWTAMTIESPGKGTYYLSLDYQTRADGTPAGEIYLVKGTYTDAAALEKQLSADNLLETVSFNSRGFDMIDKQIDLGTVDLVQGEYTLVFKAAEASKSAGSYFYLTKLTATHESIMPPPGPNEVIYDFDLQDRENGIYEKTTDLMDVLDDLDSRYASGKLQWTYHSKDNTLGDDHHCFASAYGMYTFTMEDQWMAFKIKSPGEGQYTLTMNHAQGGNGGTGAVYILPGDTEDIATAMDPSNRVGKIAFYNETGETQVTDGAVTQLGAWDFKAGEEYIMVLEAYDNSPYKAKNCYMWISQLIALEGNHMKTQTVEKKINSIVVDDSPVTQFGIGMYGAVSQVNGQDYFYFPTEGKQMFIYNLDDMVKVRRVPTPFTSMKGMCVDDDGMIWMVGDAQVLWRYDPYTNTGWTSANYKLSGGIDNTTTGLYCISASDGNIYFGSYTMGYVVRYDPRTDKFSKVTGGLLNDDSAYTSGLIERDGYLYVGVNGDRNADGKVTAEYVKIDLATDKVVDRVDITELFGQDEVMIRGVGICGDTLFAGGLSLKGFIAIDIHTMELKDYGVNKPIAIGTTEEIDGKIYFMVSGLGIRMYDSATDTITIPNKMESAVAGFRCGETNAVTLDHNPLFPGTSYVTFGGTGIKIYNVESGNVYTPPLIDEENDGSGQVIRTIIRGPEGTNTLYIGGFNTDTSAVYDITQGKVTKLFETEGQGDTLMWYDDVLYAGNYPGAYVTRVNLDDDDRNVVMLSLSGYYNQARIHALAAGDGMLFVGSIPDWYSYGGMFVAIDLETLDRVMIENFVEHQCITGLVYRDGYVFGTTSVAGGTATEGAYNDSVSAVIFVYDVEKQEKVAELDLRKYISGLPDTLPYVDGISVDPNGKLWGVISETVFSFDFDPDTGKFTVKEELSFGKTSMAAEGRSWQMCDFDYLDGYMYVALGSKGGMQKININNPSEHYRINCETPRDFILGEDGNLYYSLNTYELKMYPLHITEEDWAIAEPVDAMILALKGKSTLADRAEIESAWAAYEALSWEHKALIQNYEILEIAMTDLLEAKIDAIGEVTLGSETLIKELLAEYEALPRKQQRYVKNYQTLNAADLKLQDLINQDAAAKFQKYLDETLPTLGKITLEDEATIKQLREAYDALTFLQRQLVDVSGLLEVEGKIKALRQIKIDRLTELIAMIGEVTLEDEAIINEAIEIYNWLYLDEREQVDYVTLTAAQKALQKLQKEAAAAVDALIAAIGDSVTYASGDAIKAARAAYDALTEGSKQYVTLLDILEEAEAIYSSMFPLWAIIVIAAVGVAAAGGITAVVLRKRKKAAAQASQPTE